jgi:hypothetical protein
MASQSDSGARLPQPQDDIWTLPEIRSLRILRRRHSPPRKFQRAGRLIEVGEGTEIIIETDGEIPVRALSPVLNIGSEQVTEVEPAGRHSYRFFVVDEAVLREGAPIRLGWMGLPAPAKESRFTFHDPVGEAEEARPPARLEAIERLLLRIAALVWKSPRR